MLIFIENRPRSYHWGMTEALPEMLGEKATGEPQAELWLGDNPGSPAQVAKATPTPLSLIDLISQDPACYGVNGGPLPFLLKVLAIGQPLSLQVHPDKEQAAAGFAAENACGIPLTSPVRNYRDENHKPELLVALSETAALCGFRALADVAADCQAIASALDTAEYGIAAAGMRLIVQWLSASLPAAQIRQNFLQWVFSGDAQIAEILSGLRELVRDSAAVADVPRGDVLRDLLSHYPDDPGVLVSLFLHKVWLAPGEAIFLAPRQPHAYLQGIAVEVMASSDNVLRAGLTSKHVDVVELCRVIDTSDSAMPICQAKVLRPGLAVWRPPVADFQLLRVTVRNSGADITDGGGVADAAEVVDLGAKFPLVLIVTAGQVRIERVDAELSEVATARRGESLYASAGGTLRITGEGEVFAATCGEGFPAQAKS